MKIKFDANGIRARLTNLGNRLVTEASMKTADYFEEEFKKAIGFFYDSYTPLYYQRHHNMYQGGHSKHKAGFGGIELSAASIPSVYHDSPSYVFFQSTMQGWHGGVGIGTDPSPAEMLMTALESAAANPSRFLH